MTFQHFVSSKTSRETLARFLQVRYRATASKKQTGHICSPENLKGKVGIEPTPLLDLGCSILHELPSPPVPCDGCGGYHLGTVGSSACAASVGTLGGSFQHHKHSTSAALLSTLK